MQYLAELLTVRNCGEKPLISRELLKNTTVAAIENAELDCIEVGLARIPLFTSEHCD